MKIKVLTLFPEMFDAMNCSIFKRSLDMNLFEFKAHNIRDHAENKHNKCDDYPFGGGAGMVMMVQPVVSAINAVDPDHLSHRIYMSPRGKTFDHKKAIELSKYDSITILCGHYEGVDQRVLDNYIDEEISIGDYVLTGGELPAMVIVDAVIRQLPAVLDKDSLNEESFSNYLLEYPQYTRPNNFEGEKVPDVLLSGNHAEIEKWRRNEQERLTKNLRPDLYRKYLKEKK